MSTNRTIKKWQLERQQRYAVANTKAHLEENPEVEVKPALQASLSRAMERNAFLERADTRSKYSGCYTELDGLTGYEVDQSHKLNSGLDNNKLWWNKPTDLSYKNPLSESRLPWLEDRVGGNHVCRRGKNRAIGQSHYHDEWVLSGGGGNVRLLATRKNIAKHLTRLLSDYITAAEHGYKPKGKYDKKSQSIKYFGTGN